MTCFWLRSVVVSTVLFGAVVRPIRSADFDDDHDLTERAVAAYVAKYATKGAETATGTLDRPIPLTAGGGLPGTVRRE